jgi:hypothetical protein
MTVAINRINDEELSVNGNRVYKDQNNNWVAQNLNLLEQKSASEYIASLERYNESKTTQ